MPEVNGTQAIAIAVFAASYAAIISGKVDRSIAAAAGAMAMAIIVLRGHDLAGVVNWDMLLFIFGMMVVIGAMERSGLFRWLGLHAVRIARLDPLRLFIVLPALAAVSSAFIDSITVMLFLGILTIEVCRLARLPVLPLLIAEITAANIGGAATMIGDPPNVILGTHFGLAFSDFLFGTAPLALVGVVINIGLMTWLARHEIGEARTYFIQHPQERARALGELRPSQAVNDRSMFVLGWIALGCVVVLLATHRMTGIPVGIAGVSGASFVLVTSAPRRKTPSILASVDWMTLLFFAALFLLVGGLESSGALEALAGMILDVGGGLASALTILLWTGAVGSAVVDNVPFAATMTPVVEHLSGAGLPLLPLVWAAALGTDIGGNATPIGASANVIGLTTYERETGDHVGWGTYMRRALPTTLVVLIAMHGLLILFHA
ncbi:MAG TPA: SLC13 family permease [Actinomycetota bacterium]